ncbi:hypothetical protein EVAR_55158_1 [Eumeta japonica]|uniref:Uncharacterized protein n=1 Tax=Eumeta variegata TaxID=151549 RepID=A0A4C1YCM7_EUMVA|nr:hypothetical protein EVAR_55158_1 [Eumeta japonica]
MPSTLIRSPNQDLYIPNKNVCLDFKQIRASHKSTSPGNGQALTPPWEQLKPSVPDFVIAASAEQWLLVAPKVERASVEDLRSSLSLTKKVLRRYASVDATANGVTAVTPILFRLGIHVVLLET